VTASTQRRNAASWVVVSDLHLGAEARPPRAGAAAFAAFLTEEIASRPVPGHLLLLGDMFEMLYGGTSSGSDSAEEWAIGRLEELAAAYPMVFAALRACLQRGWRMDVVCGNHDMALCLDGVQCRLASLLDDPGRRRLDFHAWFRFVPGVLYAEHGQQHHDLNRFPAILHRVDVRHPDRLFVPPLAAAHEVARPAVVQAILSSLQHERFARSPGYQGQLRGYAEQVGLPAEAVMALHRASRVRLRAVAGRLARRAVSPSVRGTPDAYLIAASRRVHTTLTRSGWQVPLYVFGHTHHGRVVEFDRVEPSARYLNCGTWSASVRGGGPDLADRTLYPYLEICADPAGPSAALRYWRHTHSSDPRA
jgi:UDP-2,3-diacylglucosamine pyrophosphatase LpxH